MNPKIIKKNYRLRSRMGEYENRARMRGRNLDSVDDLNRDQQTHLGGVFMEIKFKSFEEFTRGNYNMIKVIGTAMTGKKIGEDYSTTFFKTQKEMLEVVEAAKVGDKLNITMKKNGNFWNPIKMVNEGVAGDVFAEQTTGSALGKAPAVSQENVAAATISAQVTAACVSAGITDEDDIAETLISCLRNASVVEDYLHKRGPFQFDGANSDIPADGLKDEGDGTVTKKDSPKSTDE